MKKSYLFPFKQVKKDSRIILYAAGAVGQAYYKQLFLTEYAEIVMWIDKSPALKGVVLPLQLIKTSDKDYDFIQIAVERENVAAEIKQELVSLGINEEKIVFIPPIACSLMEVTGQKSLFSLDELFSADKNKIEEALDDYFLYANCEIDYFSRLIDEICEYTNFDDGLKREIQSLILKYINEYELLPQSRISLILLRILFEAGCFYSEALQVYVKSVKLLDAGDSQKYWSFVDIEHIWLVNVNVHNILYNSFFIDLYNLSKEIAESWNLTWSPKSYEYYDNKRICFLLPFVYENNALHGYISPVVKEFIQLGYEVHLLDIEYCLLDGCEEFLKPIRKVYGSSRPGVWFQDYFPDTVKYHQTSVRNVIERQKAILKIVTEINPLCILDNTMDIGIITHIIYKKYPVIRFPLRSRGYASTSFHKVIIDSKDDKFYPPIVESQVVRIVPFIEKKEPIRLFSRMEYGLENSDVVCVTVGYRLPVDLSEHLFSDMCAVMAENKTIKWLIVGTETLPYIGRYSSDLIEKSIRFINYESDLFGLYQICDIYVNPLRYGGGTTISWAALSGLAIVSPKDAHDAYTLLGSAVSVESESDIASKVNDFAVSTVLLEKHKQLSKDITSGWNVKRFVCELEEEMLKLSKNFESGKL